MKREYGEWCVSRRLCVLDTQLVHSDNIPPVSLKKIGQHSTDDCAAKMARVERLGDVGATEFDDNLLASSL